MRACVHRNIEDKILQINTILEAFGNAPTSFNSNSSRFAKMIELTFSRVGKITGAKVSVFLLEDSRVLKANAGSFHVFKYVPAGLDAENLLEQHFPRDFNPDKYIDLESFGEKDRNEFGRLRLAFKILGFKPTEMDMIFKVHHPFSIDPS